MTDIWYGLLQAAHKHTNTHTAKQKHTHDVVLSVFVNGKNIAIHTGCCRHYIIGASLVGGFPFHVLIVLVNICTHRFTRHVVRCIYYGIGITITYGKISEPPARNASHSNTNIGGQHGWRRWMRWRVCAQHHDVVPGFREIHTHTCDPLCVSILLSDCLFHRFYPTIISLIIACDPLI